MKTQKSISEIPVVRLAVLIAMGIAVSSCTSSNGNGVSGSSTHAIAPIIPVTAAPQQIVSAPRPSQQVAVAPTGDIRAANTQAYATNTQPPELQPPELQTASLAPAPLQQQPLNTSGVVYQKIDPATRSLSQPQRITPDAQPVVASLNPTSDAYELKSEEMLVEEAPPTPEMLAQQRVDILYSQMTHATCKGGWATPPARLDASRETPGHPYYVEMRLRNTPLLPVGHTYIAYGRLSPDGRPLDEHVVMLSPLGGYGGAAVAAAVPMPGILKPVADDCRIKPHAAYRVTVDAQKYEKLLLRIQVAQKKIPAYALFAYNCNHFASDIVAPIGILPPKNKYAPALRYIYGVIEANEGYDPRRRRRRG